MRRGAGARRPRAQPRPFPSRATPFARRPQPPRVISGTSTRGTPCPTSPRADTTATPNSGAQQATVHSPIAHPAHNPIAHLLHVLRRPPRSRCLLCAAFPCKLCPCTSRSAALEGLPELRAAAFPVTSLLRPYRSSRRPPRPPGCDSPWAPSAAPTPARSASACSGPPTAR